MIKFIPKAEKRASNKDVSLNKLFKSRVDDPEPLNLIHTLAIILCMTQKGS